MRARAEYGRIVNGAKILSADNAMYFMTLTCRGRTMRAADAMRHYGEWTNRLLTTCRTKASRSGVFWAYVQVTEKQRRGHPHSHLITTWCPNDAVAYGKGEYLPNHRQATRDTMWSEWFRSANVSAGLGVECDISIIRNAAAVATYLSKYLFKDALTTEFSEHWRRVRYSRNYPKLPEIINQDAFPLLQSKDWYSAARASPLIDCIGAYAYRVATRSIKGDVLLREIV